MIGPNQKESDIQRRLCILKHAEETGHVNTNRGKGSAKTVNGGNEEMSTFERNFDIAKKQKKG